MREQIKELLEAINVNVEAVKIGDTTEPVVRIRFIADELEALEIK